MSLLSFVELGNDIDRLGSCLRNVVSLFHVLEKELEWRKSTGKAEGFGAMKANKPIVAVGPDHPLCDETLMADYFRKFSPVYPYIVSLY